MTQATHHPPALVTVAVDKPAPDSPFSDPDALAFWLDGDERWNLRIDTLDDSHGEAMAQAVAASPKALEWHLRRIHYAYRRREGSELHAALLDLFIVLGGRGTALKRRMLTGTLDVLEADESAALARTIDEGRMPPEREMPRAPGSRLCQGIEGVVDLVKVVTSIGSAPRDPLLEAREYIEYSQLEAARVVLETALIENPEREELHLELLALYRATRDAKSFLRMREQLLQLTDSLPEGWADQTASIRGDVRS